MDTYDFDQYVNSSAPWYCNKCLSTNQSDILYDIPVIDSSSIGSSYSSVFDSSHLSTPSKSHLSREPPGNSSGSSSSIGSPTMASSPKTKSTTDQVSTTNNFIRILNINFQSIRKKVLNIEVLIKTTNPDIILGTETWLTEEVNTTECFNSTASTDCNIYAEVYLRSIEDFCKMRPTHQITDVHFVDIDTDILLCIRSVCEKRKTLSSFQAPRASGFRLETNQKGKSRDSFGQVPHSIFVADSKPFSPRSSPIRQASMDPRVFETKLATMGRQIRSLSVPNEASLLSKTDQQVSLAHPSQVILGYPIQETPFPNQQFPSYKMNARPRGICLIISNREFINDTHHAKGEDLRSRDGTEIDSEKLADVFKRLHFIVVKKENLKDIEMTRALMDIARKDHDKYDCFVCCILSHGVQGKVYGSNSIPVEIGQLTSFVQPNSCPTLRDKPKVFFIQACQGPHTDQGFEMEADAVAHTTKLIPNEADFLLGYSTVSGYISYRAVGEGSLYIDKLVDMLNRYHKEMDLLGILTTVNDEVSKTDITYQGVYVKQMPQKVSTLRKRLCFQ
ncbi:hypothetical protein ACJMK2_006830 [Sinanodonta woodiana]|uniref:Caspase-8 n=1 Tax=Sinanodonta woodiana TaxID=1069815 RepID=A0ABD3VUC7_SINWO